MHKMISHADENLETSNENRKQINCILLNKFIAFSFQNQDSS